MTKTLAELLNIKSKGTPKEHCNGYTSWNEYQVFLALDNEYTLYKHIRDTFRRYIVLYGINKDMFQIMTKNIYSTLKDTKLYGAKVNYKTVYNYCLDLEVEEA